MLALVSKALLLYLFIDVYKGDISLIGSSRNLIIHLVELVLTLIFVFDFVFVSATLLGLIGFLVGIYLVVKLFGHPLKTNKAEFIYSFFVWYFLLTTVTVHIAFRFMAPSGF